MDHTSILLSNDTNSTEKIQSANEIINNNNLPLNTNQILLAHEKIYTFANCFKNYKVLVNNRAFILNKLLNINIRMYIAIILALCDDLSPDKIITLMIFDRCTARCIDVGDDDRSDYGQIYTKLLDYYDFDISNMSNISDRNKVIAEEYRQNKYAGKLTKSATKNE